MLWVPPGGGSGEDPVSPAFTLDVYKYLLPSDAQEIWNNPEKFIGKVSMVTGTRCPMVGIFKLALPLGVFMVCLFYFVSVADQLQRLTKYMKW